jgi:mannose-1-phosphate guanylyltransferase
MQKRDNRWALVLAAGDGRRLHSLTTTASGLAIPKQFCSLVGGPSLLHEALHRAKAVASSDHICTIVAARHRTWWQGQLDALSPSNVIVQPRNRGTANGILLPLLQILARDPMARVILLPSDHHILDEVALARSLSVAAAPSTAARSEILLLGVEPREPDPDLGYIVPRRGSTTAYREIERFVEKPPAALADELIRQDALWNTFIIAADGEALLRLFERRRPEIVAEMRRVVAAGRVSTLRYDTALAALYDNLPQVDFSRDILEGQERYLGVMPVAECGWSDLGTPRRVTNTLRDLMPRKRSRSLSTQPRGFLSLAEQSGMEGRHG